MKKHVKSVLILLTVVGMLLCLCGCTELENMRKNQAFPGENGEILWNGSVYKALPDSEALYVEDYYEDTVYLTAPDVPVLLSSMFSEALLLPSEDKAFLAVLDTDNYYCREDRYEEIVSRIQEAFVPDLVCYRYTDYPNPKYYTLTQEQEEAITQLQQTVEPTVFSDGMYLDWDYYIDLQECSQDMLFRRERGGISICDSTYYLHRYVDGQEQVFEVPASYSDIFEEITRAHVAEMVAIEAEMEEFF